MKSFIFTEIFDLIKKIIFALNLIPFNSLGSKFLWIWIKLKVIQLDPISNCAWYDKAMIMIPVGDKYAVSVSGRSAVNWYKSIPFYLNTNKENELGFDETKISKWWVWTCKYAHG